MTRQGKGRNGGNRATQNTALDARHDTGSADPLAGWFALASNVKPSRNRQQKRGWQRGARR